MVLRKFDQNLALICIKMPFVSSLFSSLGACIFRTMISDKRVPVTTAGSVLRLRMEELPSIWRVAANILNKQSRTADKVWSSNLGVGRGGNNSSP